MATIIEIDKSREYMNAPVERLSYLDFNDDGFNAFEKAKLSKNDATYYKPKVFLPKEKRDIIEDINLDDSQYPTRYAAIFFYQTPVTFVSGAYVTITMYDEKNKILIRDKIGSQHESAKKDAPKGRPLICSIEDTIAILYERYLGKYFSIDGIVREERRPIPPEVIREAVVNAHVHKDYSAGEPIRIEVRPSTIRIYNRCLLDNSIDVQSIKEGIKLNRLNTRLCEAMGQTTYYESEMSGVRRMNEMLSEAKLEDVDYELSNNTICTILPNPSGIQYSSTNEQASHDEELEEKEILILKSALKTPVSRSEVEILIGVKKSQAGETLSKLESKKFLRMTGKGRSTRYVLTESGREKTTKK